jgi:membrane-associated phospholipid phosphatase
VVTANHYVVDVVVGGLVAMTGLAIATMLTRSRDRCVQHVTTDALRGGATCSTRHC